MLHLAIMAHVAENAFGVAVPVLYDVDMVAPVARGVIALATGLLVQAHSSGDRYAFFAMVADFTFLWPLILVEARCQIQTD